MMREHLYKAKRVNWRKLPKEEWWVDGNLLISDDDHYIIPDFGVSCAEKSNNYVCDKLITLHAFEVDKETVCEYTGLTDKNGRKIFERDILSGKRYHDWGQGGEYVPDKCAVKWNEKRAAFDPVYWWEGYNYDLKDYEVIGNIFDNPDLLQSN